MSMIEKIKNCHKKGAVWSGTTLFAQICLSKNFVITVISIFDLFLAHLSL